MLPVAFWSFLMDCCSESMNATSPVYNQPETIKDFVCETFRKSMKAVYSVHSHPAKCTR